MRQALREPDVKNLAGLLECLINQGRMREALPILKKHNTKKIKKRLKAAQLYTKLPT